MFNAIILALNLTNPTVSVNDKSPYDYRTILLSAKNAHQH